MHTLILGFMKVTTSMLQRRIITAYLGIRRRASRSRRARKMYFALKGWLWRLKALVHLGAWIWRSNNEDEDLIRDSGCFDASFYKSRYGTSFPASTDPLKHFMQRGWRIGYWPNPLFDTALYLKNAPDIAALRINPLAQYIRFGASEGRRPLTLFDSSWYLQAYPDVARSGINPLAHFLKYGMEERRDPCALFSSLFYLSQYPDVAMAGLNPLVHYIESGAYEGRDPNPYFSSAWYLSRYPEVASAGRNPLEHYISEGWMLGYRPGPNFDAGRYLLEHPDIALANLNPLEHFLRTGLSEKRAQPISRHKVAELLPSANKVAQAFDIPEVDVIIPVYRGIEETARCIESVYAALCRTSYRLIVINDCSPEPDMWTFLQQAADRFGFTLLVNETNLGFVGTVNRGMALSESNDVLLLNSDAEVANDWLDRLMSQAYARDRVATVTPLSNNATICSYPDFRGRRALPSGVSLEQMDIACATVNGGRYVEVPTGVGFCMLIRRAALDELGLFDAETFGKGYGEENDFCRRAAGAGWENILAMDTFAYHAGEVSFAADSSAGKAKGMEALLSKHPRYLLEVAAHVSEDPGRAFRAAITAQLWRAARLPVVLLITHSLGGGTERHVNELAKRYAANQKVLVLRPSGTFSSAGVALQAVDDYDAFQVNVDAVDEDGLLDLISAFPISRIHIHHLFGFGPELGAAVRRSGIPFEFTAHDFYTVCPQINLTRDAVSYCGEPSEAACNACLLAGSKTGARDIRSWRNAHSWILRDASRVIAPSVDTLKRLRRYAPDASLQAIWHEAESPAWKVVGPGRQLTGGDVLKVAVLGVLAPHKGRDLVIGAAMHARARHLPLEFVVIGDPLGELPHSSIAAIRSTGRYQESELPALLAAEGPDVVLFASQWPETYSYTLSAAMNAGLPVAVPNIGAFLERVQGRPWSFAFDFDISAARLVSYLDDVRLKHFVGGAAPNIPTTIAGDGLNVMGPDDGYAWMQQSLPPIASQQDSRTRVLAVLEQQGDVPSPCAHIRLVPFLDAMQEKGFITVRYVGAGEIDLYDGDVIITHRVPVGTLDEALKICDFAKRKSIPMIYDLDDNLYDLDVNAEGGKYRSLIDIVHAFLGKADVIWASTQALASRLIEGGTCNVQIHRNQLDPSIWAAALDTLPPTSKSWSPVRIVYMGTRTHADDFAMIAPALQMLKHKYGKKIEIVLIGVNSDDVAEDYFDVLTPPEIVGASYPAFVAWIAMQQRFDIGLSPLRDNRFNRCKSEIKFLDYIALGAVPVVSDIEPYRDVADNRVNGFLVGDNYLQWVAAIGELVDDSSLRKEIIEQARRRDFWGDFEFGVSGRLESINVAVKNFNRRS